MFFTGIVTQTAVLMMIIVIAVQIKERSDFCVFELAFISSTLAKKIKTAEKNSH